MNKRAKIKESEEKYIFFFNNFLFNSTVLLLNNPNRSLSVHCQTSDWSSEAGNVAELNLKAAAFSPPAWRRQLVNYCSCSERGFGRHKVQTGKQQSIGKMSRTSNNDQINTIVNKTGAFQVEVHTCVAVQHNFLYFCIKYDTGNPEGLNQTSYLSNVSM